MRVLAQELWWAEKLGIPGFAGQSVLGSSTREGPGFAAEAAGICPELGSWDRPLQNRVDIPEFINDPVCASAAPTCGVDKETIGGFCPFVPVSRPTYALAATPSCQLYFLCSQGPGRAFSAVIPWAERTSATWSQPSKGPEDTFVGPWRLGLRGGSCASVFGRQWTIP